ncbi:RNA-binding protein 1-like [Tasmannia lanceolata]|uniref:RNA-binding protein 1-like n=1 Tax=Tasmannia lanceolata TaxID=3420 RepID=UPI004062C839
MSFALYAYTGGRARALSPPPGKRPRSDYDIPGGHEMASYFPREDERSGHRVIRDTESIGASYDRYLNNGQISSYVAGDSGRSLIGGMTGHPTDDPRMMGVGGMDLGMAGKGRSMGFGGGRPELPPLPPDASNTLFVEGLPADCRRREVSHIFRPFVGFKEVRLVNKEPRNPGGEPLVLCFVDFSNPNHAAVAMDALQGYKFDEHDRDSAILRLQFARFPGPRSGGGPPRSGGGPRGRR